MPKVCATSDTKIDMKADPLSVIRIVVKRMCFAIIYVLFFVVVVAEAYVTVQATRFLVKTTSAVMMFSYSPIGGKLDKM